MNLRVEDRSKGGYHFQSGKSPLMVKMKMTMIIMMMTMVC